MTAIGHDSKVVIDTRTARVGRSLLHSRNQRWLRNKIISVHTYTRSEGHHTYSASVLAPDRAFYLSSVSNNLVKLRTPRMGYGAEGEGRSSVGEDGTSEKEGRTRSEKKGSTTCGAILSLVSSPPAKPMSYADNGKSTRVLAATDH